MLISTLRKTNRLSYESTNRMQNGLSGENVANLTGLYSEYKSEFIYMKRYQAFKIVKPADKTLNEKTFLSILAAKRPSKENHCRMDIRINYNNRRHHSIAINNWEIWCWPKKKSKPSRRKRYKLNAQKKLFESSGCFSAIFHDFLDNNDVRKDTMCSSHSTRLYQLPHENSEFSTRNQYEVGYNACHLMVIFSVALSGRMDGARGYLHCTMLILCHAFQFLSRAV